MRASSSAFPRSCSPIGNFFPFSDWANPKGTLMPQIPARFAALVKISARYICKGSVVFSPSLNAGVGDVGETRASTFSNARTESFRTRAGIMIKQAAHVVRPLSVAHTIKTREVGRGFRRRQNVVNTNGV